MMDFSHAVNVHDQQYAPCVACAVSFDATGTRQMGILAVRNVSRSYASRWKSAPQEREIPDAA